MKKLVLTGVTALVVAGGYAAWQSTRTRPVAAAAPTIPITEGIAQTDNIPVFVRGLGTVQAYNMVSVKTQVSGQITQVLFTEGQEVKAGDPLFQIDPRPYQAALEQAQANKRKDEAQLKSARLDLERSAKLVPQGWETRQTFDQQTATVGALEASVNADQAQIDNAQLNLGYALIRSPIAGRTGARLVDIGNFVQSSPETSLVVIAQLKPIFVSFTVPQTSLDDIRQNQANGDLKAIAYAGDDRTMLAEGKLTLVDNQVDVATATIHLKATFDNVDERLWPGEFVSMRLVTSTRKDVTTVPEQSVMQGPNGSYVYIVRPDNTVERHDVEVAATQDGMAVVSKGVVAGDHVVVDGQYRLINGAKVRVGAPQATASR
jgi:membrane fusion protein, multidrug efflux system